MSFLDGIKFNPALAQSPVNGVSGVSRGQQGAEAGGTQKTGQFGSDDLQSRLAALDKRERPPVNAGGQLANRLDLMA